MKLKELNQILIEFLKCSLKCFLKSAKCIELYYLKEYIINFIQHFYNFYNNHLLL